MKSLQFHSYEVEIFGRIRRFLSIFIACHNLSSNEFDSAMASVLSSGVPPDAVRVIGYQNDTEKVRGWLLDRENVSIDRLRTVINVDSDELCFISFDEDVGHNVVKLLDGSSISRPEIVEISRRYSLLTAFREAGGMQIAPVGTHFAKTSENNADRFLRV